MELFAFGTFWFWSLLIVANIVLLFTIEYHRSFLATFTTAIFLAILHFWGGISVFSYLLQHPMQALVCFIGYFVTGSLWAIAKWWFHITSERRRYNERKQEFCERNGLAYENPIPAGHREKWLVEVNRHGSSIEMVPKAHNHKAEIYLWITWWPWSMVWTLINDPVRRLCRFIYFKLAGTFNEMSKRVFTGTENDLP